nr:DUF2505 domain-containing protein [Nakamurella flavida]
MSVRQEFDVPPAQLYARLKDRDFVTGRLNASGGQDPEVVSLDVVGDDITIVTRQGIPAAILPSMVSAMIPGDPVTERTETWRPVADGYEATFSVVVKGAPASLKGTMALRPMGTGTELVVDGAASVPIPLFGAKVEKMVAEQVEGVLRREERFIKAQPAG